MPVIHKGSLKILHLVRFDVQGYLWLNGATETHSSSNRTRHHLSLLWFQMQVEVDSGYFWSLCFQSWLCLRAQGPRCSISNAAQRQSYFVFFLHGHKDRLLMRLQSLSSDLTLGLLSRVSAHIAEKKRLYQLAVVCATQVKLKGIFKPLCGWFMVSQNKFRGEEPHQCWI